MSMDYDNRTSDGFNLVLQHQNKVKNNKDAGIVMYNEVAQSLKSLAFNILCSRFLWKGLPKHIPMFKPEEFLIRNGHALAFKTMIDANGIHEMACGILPGTFAGSVTAYGLQDHYKLVPPNGTLANKYFLLDGSPEQRSYVGNTNYNVGDEDVCVLIPNTPDYLNENRLIDYYIDQIIDLMVTYSINARSIRMPIVMYGDQNQQNSFKTQYNLLATGAPVIFIDIKQKEKFGETLMVRDTNASDGHLEMLNGQINSLWDKMLMFLGVSVIDRKDERMLVDEVNASKSESEAYLRPRLAARLNAIEQINEANIFDNEITLEINDNPIQSGGDNFLDEMRGTENETTNLHHDSETDD